MLAPSLCTRQKGEGEKGRVQQACTLSGAKGIGEWVRWQGSRHKVLEGGVALEGLGERHATLVAELVAVEPAHTAKEG